MVRNAHFRWAVLPSQNRLSHRIYVQIKGADQLLASYLRLVIDAPTAHLLDI